MFILWLISSLGVLYSIDRYISPGLLIGSSSSGVLVNTTVHSTDPRISYSPLSKCARTLLGSCKHEDDPWEPVTYFSSGMVETFFQLIEPKDKSGSRHSASISFSFKGQAIYIYGPPRRHVKNPKEHVFCLDFSCSTVDVAKIYSDASRWNDEPVLLWSQDGLSGWRSHDVRLTLEDSKSTSGLFFHHLDFTVSEKDVPPTYELGNGEKIVEVTYSDTNPYISYASKTSQPSWSKEVFSMKGMNQSFHIAPVTAEQTGKSNIPEVRWSFRGTSVAVYGAPKRQLKHAPGHSELCLDKECYPIDAVRIYKNARYNDDPVLLHWTSGLNPNKTISAVLRSLGHNSPIRSGGEAITFSKVDFEAVRPISRRPFKITAPPEVHVKHRILSTDDKVRYLPSKKCSSFLRPCVSHDFWERTTYHTSRGAERTFRNVTSRNEEVSENEDVGLQLAIPRGIKSVDLYGAPRSQLVHLHARQEACLDDACYPIDVEQAYLNVDSKSEDDAVLIWSMDDLDPNKDHTLVMRMMDDVKEIDKMVKGMTFAEAVLWEGGRPKSKKLPIAGTSSKPTTSKSSKATAKSSATKTPTATSRSTKSKNSRTTRNRSSTTKPPPSSDIYEEILTFGLAIFLVLGIMVMLRLQNDNQVAPALHYPRPRGYQQDAPLHLQFETDEDEDGEEEWIDEGPVDDATAEEIRQHDALNPKEDESEKAEHEQESGGGGDCVVCQDKEAIYCFVPCGHLCVCKSCCTALRRSPDPRCPVCRGRYASFLRVYRPS